MDRKKQSPQIKKVNRFFLYILACSTVGVVLGGTASWAESNRCWLADSPSKQCITQTPLMSTVQGMSTGLIAGICAGLGATWQMNREE
ncbi:hypothetical protein ACE1CI_05730 [Aerosakkonemataceae cyanobacterium BLCC-F50]|uniref:Uncharacterized protein n=1 Tax=Floridaenema flaviceps BLCC-F50 TaxID=3153642 RepID=A0ABV4XL68_9CYAN